MILQKDQRNRKEGEEPTIAARQAESVGANEGTNEGTINSPGDRTVENEVWTASIAVLEIWRFDNGGKIRELLQYLTYPH